MAALAAGAVRRSTYVKAAVLAFGGGAIYHLIMVIYAYFVLIDGGQMLGALLGRLPLTALYTAVMTLPFMAIGRIFKRIGDVRKRRMSDLL